MNKATKNKAANEILNVIMDILRRKRSSNAIINLPSYGQFKIKNTVKRGNAVVIDTEFPQRELSIVVSFTEQVSKAEAGIFKSKSENEAEIFVYNIPKGQLIGELLYDNHPIRLTFIHELVHMLQWVDARGDDNFMLKKDTNRYEQEADSITDMN